jgi:hypothetical protein
MTEERTQIYDILKTHIRYPGERHTGEYGVEIETETKKKYDYPELKYWTCTKDNSLRDWGVEYVLKAPMERKELNRAFEEFNLCEKKYKFNDSSISTSVHVHINMLNETYLTLANFLTTYTLVENLLIRFSGPDRLSNLFCLPIRDCIGVKDSIVKMLQAVARNNFKGSALHPDQVKYGAINCAPLTRIGTVEVRSFRGETNTEIVKVWVEILDKIKTFAKRPSLTPIEVMNLWKIRGEKLLDIIFEEHADKLRWMDSKKLMEINQFEAAEIATSAKDWKKFGIVKVKKVYKAKLLEELNQISRNKYEADFDHLDYAHRLVVIEQFHRLTPDVRVVYSEEDI